LWISTRSWGEKGANDQLGVGLVQGGEGVYFYEHLL
jgi:hypothetical protein